jgi:hypothetical protein
MLLLVLKQAFQIYSERRKDFTLELNVERDKTKIKFTIAWRF